MCLCENRIQFACGALCFMLCQSWCVRASQWHVVMSVAMSVLARMASVVSRVLCHALRVMCVCLIEWVPVEWVPVCVCAVVDVWA